MQADELMNLCKPAACLLSGEDRGLPCDEAPIPSLHKALPKPTPPRRVPLTSRASPSSWTLPQPFLKKNQCFQANWANSNVCGETEFHKINLISLA